MQLSRHRPLFLFVFVLILFAIPIYGAWYFYQHHLSWSGRTVNHGVLMQPMLRIEDLPLKTPDQQKYNAAKQWKGMWTIMYINPSACQDACRNRILTLRQVHTAMGKYQNKFQRAYVSTEALPSNFVTLLKEKFHANAFLTNNIALAHFWLAEKQGNFPAEGMIMIVDPNGYVMMRYAPNFKPEDLYNDLQRLMQVN